jgi:hypothetical protein
MNIRKSVGTPGWNNEPFHYPSGRIYFCWKGEWVFILCRAGHDEIKNVTYEILLCDLLIMGTIYCWLLFAVKLQSGLLVWSKIFTFVDCTILLCNQLIMSPDNVYKMKSYYYGYYTAVTMNYSGFYFITIISNEAGKSLVFRLVT